VARATRCGCTSRSAPTGTGTSAAGWPSGRRTSRSCCVGYWAEAAQGGSRCRPSFRSLRSRSPTSATPTPADAYRAALDAVGDQLGGRGRWCSAASGSRRGAPSTRSTPARPRGSVAPPRPARGDRPGVRRGGGRLRRVVAVARRRPGAGHVAARGRHAPPQARAVRLGDVRGGQELPRGRRRRGRVDRLRRVLRARRPSSRTAATVPYPGEENVTTLEPIGVGLAIPPWNFPLAILVGSVMGPVAAGNTVVLKPSRVTPDHRGRVHECIEEAGWPDGRRQPRHRHRRGLGDALVDDRADALRQLHGVGRTWGSASTSAPPRSTRAAAHQEDLHGARRQGRPDRRRDGRPRRGRHGGRAGGLRLQRAEVLGDVAADPRRRGPRRGARRVRGGDPQARRRPAVDDFDVTALVSERQYRSVSTTARLARRGGPGRPRRRRGRGLRRGLLRQPHDRRRRGADGAPRPGGGLRTGRGGAARARLRRTRWRSPTTPTSASPAGSISRSRERLERARREFKVGNLYFNRKITGAWWACSRSAASSCRAATARVAAPTTCGSSSRRAPSPSGSEGGPARAVPARRRTRGRSTWPSGRSCSPWTARTSAAWRSGRVGRLFDPESTHLTIAHVAPIPEGVPGPCRPLRSSAVGASPC
jgi:hypothetical protein